MIAVTGATGHLGHLILKHLTKKVSASEVIALARDPAKADKLKSLGVGVRLADYGKPETLLPALAGVTKLMFVSSSEAGNRAAQHHAVIEAAKRAGVKQIVYTSILKADSSPLELAKEHLVTEREITASGLAYTFLRNGWYIENHTDNLGPALEYGVIQGAAANGRFSSATREDYALAAVKVLSSSGHENKIYELAGDSSFTLSDLAAETSKAVGKPVVYKDHSFEDYKKILIGFGLPAPFAHLLADSDVGAARGGLQSDSKDLSNLIGKPTTTLAEVLKSVRG